MAERKEQLTGNWVESRRWWLEGSYLELWPEAVSGYWLVVDVLKSLRVAGPVVGLHGAKQAAERLLASEPGRFRKGDVWTRTGTGHEEKAT